MEYGRGGIADAECYRMSDEESARLLERGAEVIEKYGWVQGTGGNELEGMCVMGSFHCILAREPEREAIFGVDKSIELSRQWRGVTWSHRADKLLIEHTGLVGTLGLSLWNDEPGRTKEEATGLLRKVAALLTEQPTPVPPVPVAA